jgi:hypothetical protein
MRLLALVKPHMNIYVSSRTDFRPWLIVSTVYNGWDVSGSIYSKICPSAWRLYSKKDAASPRVAGQAATLDKEPPT